MLAESALSRDNDADQRHLENRFGPLGPTRVQIPPPPLFRPTNRDLDLFLGGRALPPRATQERLERLKASWPTMAKPLVAERVQQRDQSPARVPVSYPPWGVSDSPIPRWSTAMTSKSLASAGISRRQAYQVSGQPCTSSSAAPRLL